MEFGLSAEQRLLIDTVRRFIVKHLRPLEDAVEENGELSADRATSLLAKSRALGLYAMNIPADFGGGGLSAVDTMLTEQEFGQTTDILVRRAFGNVYEVLLQGDARQRERWLLPTVKGERTCSIAMTEPGAGSDAAAIKTHAIKTTTGWSLSGHKHFISDGLFSDFFVVSAVTNADAGAKGISLFLVDKDQAGVKVGRDQAMMGLRGTSHVELFFDKVALSEDCLLGKEGNGLRLTLETLGRVRLGQIGARSVGKATRILDLTTEYVRQRHQFGTAIGDFQLVQQMLADSVIEINAARHMVLQAAWELDQGGDARTQISMVKVFAAETLGRVADRAVQLFAGLGYCKDLPIERYYRDARIYRIYDGTSEIHRTIIAKALKRQGSALYDIGVA